MHYTIHHCTRPHPATFLANEHPISQSLFSAADDASITCYFTPNAVAAYHKGKVIGVFKYRDGYPGVLEACGTAVAKKFRGKGIAEKLWNAALRKMQPKTVWVTVVSDSGFHLIEKLKKRWPKIHFRVVDDRDH